MSTADIIELSLPFKAEYVSVARLTASGIANRVGFDIETIEDIKVALAEVCNKFVNIGSTKADCYKIVFKIEESKLVIIFDCEDKSLKCIFDNEIDELGISLINALMDEAEFCTSNEYLFLMSKSLEGEY
ncbi:MAG: ATP-binding protein [Clostridia bacterium]|nr:ATP-binding protein [Clostridia bacterium]